MSLLRWGMLVFVFGVTFLPAAWAKVTVDPSFTGTLVITHENGEVFLYENGDVLPEIPQNATIEVFDGTLTLTTEAGDQVQMGCFGGTQSVGGGSAASLTCEATSGKLTVDGTDYPFSSQGQESAEPTAASDPTGLPIDQDPQPDSRNIQSSVAS